MLRSKDQICQKGSQAEEQSFFKKIPCADFEKKNGMSTKKAKQNDHLLRINLQEVEGQKKIAMFFKLRGQYQGSVSIKRFLYCPCWSSVRILRIIFYWFL